MSIPKPPESLRAAPATDTGIGTPHRETGSLPPRSGVSERWIDTVLGSDPGLNRLRSAVQCVVTIAITLLAERLFVRYTHALQIHAGSASLTPPQATQLSTANHQYLVIAMLLGAIIGMISSFAVMDPTASGQFVTMLFLPVPMIPALALGIALGGHRVVSLTCLALVMAAGTYCRKFGPRGFVAGILAFMGVFFGFFLHGAIGLDDLGWLTAELAVGLVVAIVVRFGLFYPHQKKALVRTQRSYAARARRVAAMSLDLFDDPSHNARQARLLHHQLVRLNEAALMIDAQLGDASAVPDGSSAQLLHQRLFDVELALTNAARFAQTLAGHDLPDDQRSHIRLALLDIVRRDSAGARGHAERLLESLRNAPAVLVVEDDTTVLVHRFAIAVIGLTEAMTDWLRIGADDTSDPPFEPSVMLFGGWLPGSADVSATASLEAGTRRGQRIVLPAYTRTAIQMGIAVGAAIVLGDVLSGRRFYWAVIAAFITFMGANNSGEQFRKALYRVAGTVVGIGVGSLLANAAGHHTYWSITVILISIFLGFYLMRINYAFMVVGITVMVSQLYVQLDEFSNSLLLLRLEETALGAAVAVAVALLVLPLRTRHVLQIALRKHVQAIHKLIGDAVDNVGKHDQTGARVLRGDARAIDVSYQAIVATAQPLRRNLFGTVDESTAQIIRLASASRHYSRNLIIDLADVPALRPGIAANIRQASDTLLTSLDAIANALPGRRDVSYIRAAALFDHAESQLESSSTTRTLWIRDLMLIDAAMALTAEAMGLPIDDPNSKAGQGSP